MNERWVDASAVEDGDGSQARPFKHLREALAPDTVVNVRSGLYAGPFVLPPRTTIIGHGQAVLYGEGELTVISAPGAATLEALSVQGGFTGLRAIGPTHLKGVHFSGHRRTALETEGEVRIEDSVFDGTVAGSRGVVLRKGARATLRRLKFTGAFKAAVEADGARVDVEELTSAGPAQALHLVDCQSDVRQVTISGGTGPGIFVGQGALVLTGATVNGHEYGLQAREAQLTVRGFTSRRVQLAGIATVKATGTLREIETEQSGSYGGLQLLESVLEVQGVRMKQARATGVFVRLGKLKLDGVIIDQVLGERDSGPEHGGDGLHLRDADVVASNVVVRDAAGVGAFLSAAARVELRNFSCERCRVGAVVAELAAVVTVKGMTSRGGEGPAIAVLDRASVTVEGADISAVQVPVWAECDHGARVSVKALKSNLPLPPSGCIARE